MGKPQENPVESRGEAKGDAEESILTAKDKHN